MGSHKLIPQVPPPVQPMYLELFKEFFISDAVVQVAGVRSQLWNGVTRPCFNFIFTWKNIIPDGQASPQPIHGFFNFLWHLGLKIQDTAGISGAFQVSFSHQECFLHLSLTRLNASQYTASFMLFRRVIWGVGIVLLWVASHLGKDPCHTCCTSDAATC